MGRIYEEDEYFYLGICEKNMFILYIIYLWYTHTSGWYKAPFLSKADKYLCFATTMAVNIQNVNYVQIV